MIKLRVGAYYKERYHLQYYPPVIKIARLDRDAIYIHDWTWSDSSTERKIYKTDVRRCYERCSELEAIILSKGRINEDTK